MPPNTGIFAEGSTLPEAIPGSIMDNCVCLSLDIRMFGVRRKLPTSKVEIDADKTLLRASKAILECDEYEAIQQLAGAARKSLDKIALPSPLKAGTYLVPMGLVAETDEAMQRTAGSFYEAVEVLMDNYEERAAETRERLRVAFDVQKDTQEPDAVRRKFSYTWRWFSFGVAANLEKIRADIFQRATAEINRDIADATQEIRDALRASFAELVSHMAERTQTDARTGKPKIFRDTLVTNLADFLQTISARNVTGDSELSTLADQARSILRGVTPEILRQDQTVRAATQSAMAEMLGNIDSWLVDKPSRKITLAEDD